MIKRFISIFLILILAVLPSMAAMDPFYPQEVATGQIITPRENLKAPWFGDDALLTFGDGKDATISYDDAMDKLYFNNTPIYLEEAVTAPAGITGPITGDITGTASRIAVGSFIDTGYGLKNSTANKAQVNITADKGLEFGTGADLGALQAEAGNGIKLSSAGIAVEPSDIIGTSYGLMDSSDDIRINLTTNDGLEFGTGATLGSLGVITGDGLDTGATGVLVDATDIINTEYGLYEPTANDIGINLTANKGLELGTGALLGSLGIKLDGYSLVLGASGLKLNASDAQEVDTIAVNDADGLTVNGQIVPVYETLIVPINNQSVDEYVFIADDLWYLVKAEEVHSVAGTAVAPDAANLTIRICDDAEAVTGGINATVSVIPLNDAANTINTGTLNSSNIAIQNGDMIAFDYAGTLTDLRGSVTLTLRRM